MARKPIQTELAGGKSQRQRIWENIRATKGRGFDQRDVTPGGVPDATAKDYLRGLANGGFLTATLQGKAPVAKSIYKLARDVGAEAPRVNRKGEVATQGQGNEAIWGAMQALGSFTPRVLSEMSDSPEQTVKTYCKMLERADYLTVDRQGKGTGRGGIMTRYRLNKSRVKGPRPPMITRLKAVYDPNIHQIVWQQNADDALEATEAV